MFLSLTRRFTFSAPSLKTPHSVATQLLTVLPKDALRLAPGAHTLEVTNGNAWISTNGQDFIVRTGETCALRVDQHGAVLSGLGTQPLVLARVGRIEPQ